MNRAEIVKFHNIFWGSGSKWPKGIGVASVFTCYFLQFFSVGIRNVYTLCGFPDSSVGKESTCSAEDWSLIPGSGRSPGEGIGYLLQYSWASLVAQLVKNLPTTRRPGFNPWVWKIPWRKEMLPAPVFWPGEFYGLYSPWGHKDMSLCLNYERFKNKMFK